MRPAPPRPRVAPQAAAPPTRELQAGDLICGECGEGNDPVRKFCSRCGTSLGAAVVHTEPWYRRLIPRRRPKVLEAGARPGRGAARSRRPLSLQGVVRMVRLACFAVLFVGGLLYGVSAPFRTLVGATVSRPITYVSHLLNPQYDLIHDVAATSPAGPPPGSPHEAAKAVDGFKTTFWSAEYNKATQPSLNLTFLTPHTVDKVLFSIGNADNYAADYRPWHVQLLFPDHTSQTAELLDRPDPQEVDLENPRPVSGVMIRIIDVYPAFNAHLDSIAEVELFTRR
jgi:hypothetical protein